MIMESEELVQRRKIEEIINIRNESIRIYQMALDNLAAIRIGLDTLGECLSPVTARLDDVKEFAKRLDEGLWLHCMDKLGIFTVMDSGNVEKFKKEIHEKTPEFTIENIEASTKNLYEHRKDFFVEGIINTFRNLSADYKTNSNDKFKIPDKCIMRYMIDPGWSYGFHISYRSENRLSDIQRTFCVLDKKEFVQRQAVCEANEKLKNKEPYENEYFELKGHKNGNAHIKFKRIDLLDKANQLIADYYGNTLKG